MDDAGEPCPGVWPLHPQPCQYETLTMWVERVAAAYGVSFRSFSYRVLGLPYSESVFLSENPSQAVLERLAAGTGVPVTRLREMTIGVLIPQIQRELDVHLGTLEPGFTAWVVERSRRCADGFKTDPEYWRVIGEWQKRKDDKARPASRLSQAEQSVPS